MPHPLRKRLESIDREKHEDLQVLKAARFSWWVCSHGTLWMMLHDAQDIPFAVARLEQMHAAHFLENSVNALDEAVALQESAIMPMACKH